MLDDVLWDFYQTYPDAERALELYAQTLPIYEATLRAMAGPYVIVTTDHTTTRR